MYFKNLVKNKYVKMKYKLLRLSVNNYDYTESRYYTKKYFIIFNFK